MENRAAAPINEDISEDQLWAEFHKTKLAQHPSYTDAALVDCSSSGDSAGEGTH